MSRKPCQCNSSCHAVGCERCCDCGADLLGPIERELRGRAAGDRKLGSDAYRVFTDAMFSLHDQWGTPLEGVSTKRHWPDIMSEAIEAAEALGL